MILSVLICSLEERAEKFNKLHSKILELIKEGGFENEVEVLTYIDNRNTSTGNKRNHLKLSAKGLYVCNIDDDDDISAEYFLEIINAIKKSNADAITFIIDKYTDGKFDYRIIPSKNGNSIMVGEGNNRVLMTQVTHLCPHKKELADKISYPDLYRMADYHYEIELKKLIKTEYCIEKTLYMWKDSSVKYIPNI